MRTFTLDGPVDPSRHYVLPAAPRLAEARSLVDQGAYFIVRAPHRTGKTTALRALATEMTSEGRYAALVCSAKLAAPAHSDVLLVQQALLAAIRIAAERDLPPELQPPVFAPAADMTHLYEGLAAWARVCPLPIVLFFDDLDSLHGAALECVLQQLETGFSRRPGHFPWSVGLGAAFDLRRTSSSEADVPEKPFSTGPFERFWSSRLLPPLTREEIRALYTQHFATFAARFTDEALESIHEASAGHVFHVQALGQALAQMSPQVDQFTKSQVVDVQRQLISEGLSPIDALATRLLESRVRRVIEPLIAGSSAIASVADADLQFVRDIGLVAADEPVRIEGAIHRALVPHLLVNHVRRAVMDDPAQCFDENGRIAIDRLLAAFGGFYAAHAADLIDAIPYSKIAHELIFLGFLAQMLESRATIDLEFGASRGRVDVVAFSASRAGGSSNETTGTNTAEQREVFVLVARRKGDSGVKKRGLEWLETSMRQNGTDSGTLVIFDKRGKRSAGRRIKVKELVTEGGKTVRLLRV
ncbi:MAG TPA: hypothetical protein PK156_02625 [Polyangium sp.]|nr:hypothetical protein [Polyangium sp.]